MEEIEYAKDASIFTRYNSEKANIGVQFFNKGMVILSTFAPNDSDDIEFGDRLIMMYEGRIALDIAGEEKKKLTVEDLLAKFGQVTGSTEADDKLLLA